ERVPQRPRAHGSLRSGCRRAPRQRAARARRPGEVVHEERLQAPGAAGRTVREPRLHPRGSSQVGAMTRKAMQLSTRTLLPRITHHEGMTLLTGATMRQVSGLFSKAGGPSVDQLAADQISAGVPIRSIQVGVSKRLSIMDSGTTMHNLSHAWTGDTQTGQDVP